MSYNTMPDLKIKLFFKKPYKLFESFTVNGVPLCCIYISLLCDNTIISFLPTFYGMLSPPAPPNYHH